MENKLPDKKKPQTSKAWKVSSKSKPYNPLFLYRENPAKDGFLIDLAEDLVDWVNNLAKEKNPRPYKMNDFFRSKGIHIAKAREWRKINPKLDYAYSYALEVLGDIRELGAIEGRFSPQTFRRLVFYNQDARVIEQYHAKLKEEDTQSASNFKVVMTPIPSEEK